MHPGTHSGFLKEILRVGKIEAGLGYVKGSQRGSSEIPLHGFAAQPSEERPFPRYEFYGIAISKSSGFRLGSRPVIYLPDAEAGYWSRHAPVSDVSQAPAELLAKFGLTPEGRKIVGTSK
jgi:hypothetical protein